MKTKIVSKVFAKKVVSRCCSSITDHCGYAQSSRLIRGNLDSFDPGSIASGHGNETPQGSNFTEWMYDVMGRGDHIMTMKKKLFLFSLLAIVALWCALWRVSHSAYQRGYSQGTRDAQLRFATSQPKTTPANVSSATGVVTLDNEMAPVAVTRAAPGFKNTSGANAVPISSKP